MRIKQYGKEVQVVEFLLRGHPLESKIVKVNALNGSGLTPLDVLTLSESADQDRDIREILVQAGAKHKDSRPVSEDGDDIRGGDGHQSYEEPVPQAHQSLSRSTSKKSNRDGGESWGDKRNTLLVVAALIVNATYQSVLQPPSIVRYYKDQNSFVGSVNKLNNITYGGGLVYILFLGGNTFGFLVSVQMIICLTNDLIIRWPLMLALIAMVQTYLCFMLSLLITSTRGPATAIVLNVMPLMIAVFLLLIQKWLAMILVFFSKNCFQLKIFGDLYEITRAKVAVFIDDGISLFLRLSYNMQAFGSIVLEFV
ncbi:hypothetical protein ACJRO7_020381 [Eucalyptus globulus]|uniref:PGG domain-containing protein n=1 Tax=Eucalyptus globulus TaxID=34317 RepID=A0ABD3KGB8_EUCGL